jgi:O-antigen/teichoic acid export membrane protein
VAAGLSCAAAEEGIGRSVRAALRNRPGGNAHEPAGGTSFPATACSSGERLPVDDPALSGAVNTCHRLDSDGYAARLRARRLKYAIGTALLSKGGTAILQLVAIPIAIRVLGVQGYALYVAIVAVVTSAALVTITVGPALVVRVAAAVARDDRSAQRQLFTSTLVPVGVNVLALASAAVAVLSWSSTMRLFSAEFAGQEPTIRVCLPIMVAMQLVQPLLAVVEGVQAGYQEQYLLNLRGLLGNVGCVMALALMPYWPSVLYMLFAVQGPPVLSRLANAAWFLWRRPFLLPRWSGFAWRDCRAVVGDGLMFSLAGAATTYLCHCAPVIVLGRTAGTRASASFAAGMTLLTMAAGVISMICIPLWPAIADSIARGDNHWARRAYGRTFFFGIGFAVLAAAAIFTVGGPAFRLCFGAGLTFSSSMLLAMGLYFVVLTWEQIHYSILAAMGRIAPASLIFLARAVLSVLATSALGAWTNECRPFLVMTAVGAATTCPAFFFLLHRTLPRQNEEETPAPREMTRFSFASLQAIGRSGR